MSKLYSEAVKAITQVINNGGYVNIIVDEAQKSMVLNDSERRLLTKLIYGTVENKILIDYYLKEYTHKKRIKPLLRNTLRMAVYALLFLNIADHFIVNTAVEIVKKTDYKGSRLVNAILRSFLKDERPDLSLLRDRDYLSIKYSVPSFIVDLLKSQYPGDAEDILKSYLETSELALRINTLKGSAETVKKILSADQIEFEISDNVMYANQSLLNHPLFLDGLVTYQDVNSQLVSTVLDPLPGEDILDACSAPGGKTAHMAALANNLAKIVAVDIYEHKLKLMAENFERLGVENVELVLEDATLLPKIFKEGTFDKILVDAPCSGLGVIAHKVDLKYQLDEEKVRRLISLQARILDSVEPLIKDGGYLIYSTCTINQEENENQITAFLKRHPRWQKRYEKTFLPTKREDGFYICKLSMEETNES